VSKQSRSTFTFYALPPPIGNARNSRSFKARIGGPTKAKNRQGDAKAALLHKGRKRCIDRFLLGKRGGVNFPDPARYMRKIKHLTKQRSKPQVSAVFDSGSIGIYAYSIDT
jgi:hypothetical protein